MEEFYDGDMSEEDMLRLAIEESLREHRELEENSKVCADPPAAPLHLIPACHLH